MNSKQLNIVLGIAVVLLLALVGYLSIGKTLPQSYDQCVKAGGEISMANFIKVAGSPGPDQSSICRFKGRTFQNSVGVKDDPTNSQLIN